jgi:hypothetical protein
LRKYHENMMTNEWKECVLNLRHRETEEQDLEFVSLVGNANGNCDLDTCRILMSTFVTDHDFGVQEAVVSALSTANVSDYQRSLLEELPRLVTEVPEWAAVLVDRELTYRFESFRRYVSASPDTTKEVLQRLLQKSHLGAEFPFYNPFPE